MVHTCLGSLDTMFYGCDFNITHLFGLEAGQYRCKKDWKLGKYSNKNTANTENSTSYPRIKIIIKEEVLHCGYFLNELQFITGIMISAIPIKHCTFALIVIRHTFFRTVKSVKQNDTVFY